MSQNITRRNHYIPQFYLKNWSLDGKTIRTYSILVSNANVPYWTQQSIKNTAVWNDFYTRVVGYVVDMLDTMFMDFPVFNVADVFVVCGTICALIYYLAFYGKYDEKHRENKTDGTDPAANK